MGLKARWGKKLAAVAVGAATIVGMSVAVAPNASAYYYSGGGAGVSVSNLTPIGVMRTSANFTQRHFHNISAPRMIVYRNGVPVNQQQVVTLHHKLWQYSTGTGWFVAEQATDTVVIGPGWNSAWTSHRQFNQKYNNAWYFVETDIRLYATNGQLLYFASMRPNSTYDFDCSSWWPAAVSCNKSNGTAVFIGGQ